LPACSLSRSETQWMPPWDSVDLAEVATYAGLTIADGFTSAINTSAGCSESDPLITGLWGTKYPRSADYAVSMAINAAVVVGVAEILPSTWRKLWLLGFIGDESWALVNNTQVHCAKYPPQPLRAGLTG
jgi:predicted branched-subunit amino acid permease